MLIADIQSNIKTRLAEKIKKLKIESFPKKPDEYEFLHPVGVVLVYYKGSTYSTSRSISSIVQDKKSVFGLTIMIRNLDLEVGSYKYLDEIKDAITGYQIDGCSKIYPVRDELLNEDDGIWQYGLDVALTYPSAEITEEPKPFDGLI